MGFARTPMTDDVFRTCAGDAAKTISEVGPIDPKEWADFASNLYYSPGDYADQEAYAKLARRLAEIESAKNLGGNHFFFLSPPPPVHPNNLRPLAPCGLSRSP